MSMSIVDPSTIVESISFISNRQSRRAFRCDLSSISFFMTTRLQRY